MTTHTTRAQKAARRKLNLVELANDLGNVSGACRRAGFREQFYEIRRNYQTFGSEGLPDNIRGPRKFPPVTPARNRNKPSWIIALHV
jgi:hypothetical protein